MKALVKVARKYGCMEIREVPKPKIKPNELLIEVKATTPCGSELYAYEWSPYHDRMWQAEGRPLPPIVLGHEFSGVVRKVGEQVKEDFVEGDFVTAEPHYACGKCIYCREGKSHICKVGLGVLSITVPGSYAEYISVPASETIKLPKTLSHEEGALIEPMGVAAHGFERAKIGYGDSVVIIGPGPIGLFALAIAKLQGATKTVVTGLGTDKPVRLEFAKKLGADEIINVDERDPVKRVLGLTEDYGADVVFETSGSLDAFVQATQIVRKAGTIVQIGTARNPAKYRLQPILFRIMGKEINLLGSTGRTRETWRRCIETISAGKIDLRSWITHRMTLNEADKGFRLMIEKKAIKVMFTPLFT